MPKWNHARHKYRYMPYVSWKNKKLLAKLRLYREKNMIQRTYNLGFANILDPFTHMNSFFGKLNITDCTLLPTTTSISSQSTIPSLFYSGNIRNPLPEFHFQIPPIMKTTITTTATTPIHSSNQEIDENHIGRMNKLNLNLTKETPIVKSKLVSRFQQMTQLAQSTFIPSPSQFMPTLEPIQSQNSKPQPLHSHPTPLPQYHSHPQQHSPHSTHSQSPQQPETNLEFEYKLSIEDEFHLQTFIQSRTFELQTHQIHALRFLYHGFFIANKRCLLIDGKMGCGKTNILIQFANWMKRNLLFIAPNDILFHLEKQAQKWKDSNIRISISDYKTYKTNMTRSLAFNLIGIDECHIIIGNQLNNKRVLLKEIKQMLKDNPDSKVILFSGTPGDEVDQAIMISHFENGGYQNVESNISMIKLNWESNYTPKIHKIPLTLSQEQKEIYKSARSSIKQLTGNQNAQYKLKDEIRQNMSIWKVDEFITNFCLHFLQEQEQPSQEQQSQEYPEQHKHQPQPQPQLKQRQYLLVVSEYEEVINHLTQSLLVNLPKGKAKKLMKSINKNTPNIGPIITNFENGEFVLLIALASKINHGLDLYFVNQLLFIEPQFLLLDQMQANGRLPRLGHENTNQTIITPFYIKTIDDMLYQTHEM